MDSTGGLKSDLATLRFARNDTAGLCAPSITNRAIENQRSLIPQGHHGINARSSPSRQVAGSEGHERDRERCAGHNPGSVNMEAMKACGHQSGQSQ
jgi:hypothetical protein